jgi:hypothetical protein
MDDELFGECGAEQSGAADDAIVELDGAPRDGGESRRFVDGEKVVVFVNDVELKVRGDREKRWQFAESR